MRFAVRPVAAMLFLAPLPALSETYVVHRLPANAQQGYADVHISKATLPGERTRLWWAMMLNPDCSPAGTMTTEILQPPRHGEAAVADEPFFPGFVSPNPRAACDTRKAPGKQLFYTAQAGYRGHDKLVLRNATSEGRIRRVVVDIDVR